MNFFNRNASSPFGELDIMIKLSLGFTVSMLIVLVDSIFFLMFLTAISIISFALCYPNKSQLKLVFFSMGLLVWGLMVSQGIFYNSFPRNALIVIIEPNFLFKYGLKIYHEGIIHGAIQSFRMVTAGCIGYAICFSTEPDTFLKGLTKLKVPYSLSFMGVTAIRFIPIVTEELFNIRNAMKIKGYKPFKKGFFTTIKNEISSIRPILAGTIRRSQEVALSIQSRGFSINTERSSFYHTPLSLANKFIIALIYLFLLVTISLKLLFQLYQWQIFYNPDIRPLYEFIRKWL